MFFAIVANIYCLSEIFGEGFAGDDDRKMHGSLGAGDLKTAF